MIAHMADNEFEQARSGRGCHPERSEGSLLMGPQMLRCAQHDRTGFGCENSSSALGVLSAIQMKKVKSIIASHGAEQGEQ
jgi:hypothetical protein